MEPIKMRVTIESPGLVRETECESALVITDGDSYLSGKADPVSVLHLLEFATAACVKYLEFAGASSELSQTLAAVAVAKGMDGEQCSIGAGDVRNLRDLADIASIADELGMEVDRG